jgi:hypothetical protein
MEGRTLDHNGLNRVATNHKNERNERTTLNATQFSNPRKGQPVGVVRHTLEYGLVSLCVFVYDYLQDCFPETCVFCSQTLPIGFVANAKISLRARNFIMKPKPSQRRH